MDTWKEIDNHLIYLTEHLTNLFGILLYLVQTKIISNNEKQLIELGHTIQEKNLTLLDVLKRKELPLQTFLDLLRSTNNEHCADTIEGVFHEQKYKRNPRKILKNTWWPENKLLIKSLYKRKIGGKSLVEEIHERLSKDENRMVVITESVNASKLCGMGGVGKTLTSKWYANQYENEYDHVVWIDCGEGSLLTSFQKLAIDLEVRHWEKLVDAEDYVRKCYEYLQEYKCLWIFDNAENYHGDEGIQNILPKLKINFYCLITSRSRNWGTQNVGYGSISMLELDIFGDIESLEFLKGNLRIEYNEDQLKELCLLLGNLPLALQLAVAALNNGKIDLQNYIQKNAVDDVEIIVDIPFDGYEKTINKNIKISLDLIAKETHGTSATTLLTIFGYIRPDDVQSKFLMKIMKVELNVLKEAIDLLVKYSLVTKTRTVQETPYDDGILNKILGRSKENVDMDLLSIHRLLQQVIRHNGRKTEKETLKKILGCGGFLDYKLIPFTKYADDNLKKEFPKVKAQLLDQQQLKTLLKVNRLEESVQLARFIDQEMNTKTTKFNYAICLEANGQLEEAANALKPLLEKHEIKNDVKIAAEILFNCNLPIKEIEYRKLVDLSKTPTQSEVGRFLYHLYIRLDKNENAFAILKEHVHEILGIASSSDILSYLMQEEAFQGSLRLAKVMNEEIGTMTTKFNYAVCLGRNGQMEAALEIMEDINSELSRHKNVLKSIRVGEAEQMLLNCIAQVQVPLHNTSIKVIDLKREPTQLDVHRCLLYFHLKMGNTYNKLIQHVLQSDKDTLLMILSLIDTHPNYSLEINGYDIRLVYKQTKEIEINNSSLNVSLLPPSIQTLTLYKKTKVFWSTGIDLPNLKYLTLNKISCSCLSLFKSVKLNEIEIWYSSLDISLLPPTLQKLRLQQTDLTARGSGGIDLPNLKYLELRYMSSSCLSHFKSTQLTHIDFWCMEVNVDLLPPSVKNIRINSNYPHDVGIIGSLKEVDKLVLELLSWGEVGQVLSHLHPKLLVIYCYPKYDPKELNPLLKKHIQTIAVNNDRIQWTVKSKESPFSKDVIVDGLSDYYLLEGRRWKAIEWKEFRKLLKLLE